MGFATVSVNIFTNKLYIYIYNYNLQYRFTILHLTVFCKQVVDVMAPSRNISFQINDSNYIDNVGTSILLAKLNEGR